MARERYTSQPTHIEGFSLRTAKDRSADIGKGEMRSFCWLHRKYVREDRAKKGAEANQAELKKQLVCVAETFGVRGGEDREDNSVLTVSSVSSRKWDFDLLRQALGDAYQTVVHDDVQVVISLVPGVDKNAVANGLKDILNNAKVTPEDMEKLIQVKISPRIDEKAIDEMVERGSLVLPEGALTETTSWAVIVDPLDKSLPKTKRRKMPKYFPSKQ